MAARREGVVPRGGVALARFGGMCSTAHPFGALTVCEAVVLASVSVAWFPAVFRNLGGLSARFENSRLPQAGRRRHEHSGRSVDGKGGLYCRATKS